MITAEMLIDVCIVHFLFVVRTLSLSLSPSLSLSLSLSFWVGHIRSSEHRSLRASSRGAGRLVGRTDQQAGRVDGGSAGWAGGRQSGSWRVAGRRVGRAGWDVVCGHIGRVVRGVGGRVNLRRDALSQVFQFFGSGEHVGGSAMLPVSPRWQCYECPASGCSVAAFKRQDLRSWVSEDCGNVVLVVLVVLDIVTARARTTKMAIATRTKIVAVMMTTRAMSKPMPMTKSSVIAVDTPKRGTR